ncbi:MAG: MBL fold metallo-hydrolase [Anaerolineae bacterium]|nr:MBL fold metallo-hydrolase [Anaerolineae bacterium]
MEIGRIQTGPTNCYLLRGQSGVVVVDPGPPGGGKHVIAGIEAAGIPAADVTLILVTHGHLDHYGAALDLHAWCGAPLAAHPNAAAFSRDRRNAIPPAGTLRGSVVRWAYLLLAPFVYFQPLHADVLLDGDTDLSPHGIDASTILLPGHSPEHLGVLTGERDLLAGDLFVNYTVPSRPLYLMDRAAWDQSYERVRALAPRRVLVGHGEPFEGEALSEIYPARYQFRWWVR